MPEEISRGLDLLYPFYLDTDMTMAFAAALTGGVAMQAEGVDSVGRESEKSRDLNAGLRLFEMLDLGGKTKRSRKGFG